MKGYAIIFIVLHNFLHMERRGFVQENEMKFVYDNACLFFDRLHSPNLSILGDFFSFIGWVGVPVFVFLSGYGLALKYKDVCRITPAPYLWHSYAKLFSLLLPAAIFFTASYVLYHDWSRSVCSLLTITMLQNFFCNIVPFTPGIYWYFGLTFQLYVIYLFLHRKDHSWPFIISAIVCLILLFILNPKWIPDQDFLYWLRHNFIGWMPQFALGVICAKSSFLKAKNEISFGPLILLTIISFILMFFLNINYILWLFLPFASICFFYSLAKLSTKCKRLYFIGVWLGKISPYIFVFHPIARTVMLHSPVSVPLFVEVLIYLSITVFGSLLYRPIHRSLMSLLHC